jgi:probable dihydroxyacetone kinase regulator
MSKVTKHALYNSFLKLLGEKPFPEISVKDITEESGVSRMTFYYHFEDIYHMISWATEEKLKSTISGVASYDGWREDYLGVFKMALVNRKFFTEVFPLVDRGSVDDYLSSLARKNMLKVIDEKTRLMNVKISNESKEMIADVYSCSIAGMFLKWIAGGMKEDPDTVVGNVAKIINNTLDSALLSLS